MSLEAHGAYHMVNETRVKGMSRYHIMYIQTLSCMYPNHRVKPYRRHFVHLAMQIMGITRIFSPALSSNPRLELSPGAVP